MYFHNINHIVLYRYEGKQRKMQSRAKSDRDKLTHKLKKETKGALREIRRDKDFLAGIKLRQKIQRLVNVFFTVDIFFN